ncbi:MAG: cofactor-independent phosphoglycerate mutase [Desulfurivibrionaceae bacterium]|nr:cofactor-independent phosphoglycerate mutase [Desulfurivibrionaceae bacterium]
MPCGYKIVILIGDGMGDLPIAELGGLTPLEYVDTPAMDFVAANGELAMLKTIPDGFPPGSDVANLSLFGYRPEEFYTGRSPLEAASMGVELGRRDTAFRCNLVTLDRAADGRVIMVDYSGGHISTPEARELIDSLAEALNDDNLRFHSGVSYRHLLVVKDGPENYEAPPPHDFTGQDVTGPWNDMLKTPLLGKTIRKACGILVSHEVNRQRLADGKKPANAIWLWGQGRAPVMPTLSAKYGIEGSLISAVDLLKGIGVYAGLRIVNVEGATGYLDTDYAGKVAAALRGVGDGDLVVVHVEAPDEAGHQGSRDDKLKAIADFDAKVVKPVLEGLRKGPPFRLVVAMDHFTPLSTMTHESMPVPVAIYDSERREPASGLAYTERNGLKTGVFYADGQAFFNRLMRGG